MELQLLKKEFFAEYCTRLSKEGILHQFESLLDSELSTSIFSFHTSVSAVYSSKTEGEAIELESYFTHRLLQSGKIPEAIIRTDDLYRAYLYAHKHPLNIDNLMVTHAMICRHILPPQLRGRIRNSNMIINMNDDKWSYVAVSKDKVLKELEKLFLDINELMKADLDILEVFYYASFIHLIFVKIHPMADGNGRLARLLEKWFISSKLGHAKTWFVQSERYYFGNFSLYMTSLDLGSDYDKTEYKLALPFLWMLPESLKLS